MQRTNYTNNGTNSMEFPTSLEFPTEITNTNNKMEFPGHSYTTGTFGNYHVQAAPQFVGGYNPTATYPNCYSQPNYQGYAYNASAQYTQNQNPYGIYSQPVIQNGPNYNTYQQVTTNYNPYINQSSNIPVIPNTHKITIEEPKEDEELNKLASDYNKFYS